MITRSPPAMRQPLRACARIHRTVLPAQRKNPETPTRGASGFCFRLLFCYSFAMEASSRFMVSSLPSRYAISNAPPGVLASPEMAMRSGQST